MPESDVPSSNRARSKPQQETRKRMSTTDQGQESADPSAGMQELQYTGESLVGSDFSQETFERHAELLGNSRLSRPANAAVRMQIAQKLQRDYGNQYVQRLVKHNTWPRTAESNRSLSESPLAQAPEDTNRTGNAYVGKDVLAHEPTYVSHGGEGSEFNGLTVARDKNDSSDPVDLLRGSGKSDKTMVSGFPVFIFEGAADAYDDIARQFKKDPRDPSVNANDLGRIIIPYDKNTNNYKIVIDQLLYEASLRFSARLIFQGMDSLASNLRNNFQDVLQIVTSRMALQNSDVVNIFMTRMISEGLEAIDKIPMKAAPFVSEALKVAWDVYKLASAAASANKVSVGVIDATQALMDEFNSYTASIETMKTKTFNDWSELQRIGQMTWPKNSESIRNATTAYEISLWKTLLPLKWKVYTSSNGPRFSTSIDYIQRVQARNPHVWHTFEQGAQENWYGDKQGWYVTEHWLGNGTTVYTHTTPEAKLVERIYSLGVSREELLLGWGLPKDTFFDFSNQQGMGS